MPDQAIEMLIVSNAMSEAESYLSALRNAGMAVHLTRIDQDTKAFRKTIDSDTPFDLLLLTTGSGSPDIDVAIGMIKEASRELPLIVLQDVESSESKATLLAQGARDVVNRKDTEHLTLVVQREFDSLTIGRQLQTLRQQLKETEARCETLTANSRDAIAYIYEGMHVKANSAYLEMFGQLGEEEIEGMPILDMIAPANIKKFKKLLRQLSSDARLSTKLEFNCLHGDGTTFNALLEFSPASIDGEPCTQLLIRDQTNSKELEEKLRLLTTQDLQTGLSNRQHFMDLLEETARHFAQEEAAQTLLYITLDNYQDIRSKVGIASCDQILGEAAEILRENINQGDLLARFGDHTFTLLTQETDPQKIEALSRQICQAIKAHKFQGSEHYSGPTSSIGIAYASPEISGGHDFLNVAYHACEQARLNGGNQFYSVETPAEDDLDDDLNGNEADLSHLIEYALSNDQFRLVYQPIVSLQGDTRENYAVLIRLLDQNGEEIQPNYFLKQAEEMGKLPEVDRWVIRNAIAELAQQRRQGHKINFFINISGVTLADDTLLLWICDCLREFEAKGPWVVFQIKDEEARAHLAQVQKLSEGLQKIKCQLSIDHFGLAPKPEMLLRNLPVNYIQFDPMFVHNIASDQKKQDSLNEVNKLGQQFDIKTVATGVEDANSLAVLWSIGVNYIRGYFLQEPDQSINYDFSSH